MHLNEYIYLALVLLGILIAAKIIGLRHLCHIASPAAWFLLSVAVAYFIRPLIFFLNNDWFEWNALALPPFEVIGLKYGLVVGLFVIAFALGYGPSSPLSSYLRTGKEHLSPGARKSIYAWLVVFAIFGFCMAAKYRPLPGFGDGVVMEHVGGWTVFTDTTGYLVNAVNLVPACGMIYYAMSGRLGVTALLVAPFVLMQMYFGWGRSQFLLPTIGFLGLAALLSRTSRGNLRQVAAIILALLLMLPVLAVLGDNRDFFKQKLEGREMAYQMERAQKRWTASEGADLTGFPNTAFYIAHSGKTFPHGYCLRWVYILFLQPIPRMFWKNKPVPSDFDTKTISIHGMAPGTLGDPYHQLGWFGVVLFFIHGWMVKRAMVWFANPGRPSLLGAYGFLLAYGVWTPLGWVTALPFYLLPVLTTYLIERRGLLSNMGAKRNFGRPPINLSQIRDPQKDERIRDKAKTL